MAIDPPGVTRDPTLNAHLEAAYAEKGPDYNPKTHNIGENGRATYVNRLIFEPSPYLAQHAHNPVDWYPWGPEAFAVAKENDLPIFLSVGYATCHWCHVMATESFGNEMVAQFLNTHFVPIKVDREQLPAIDQIYITATQLQQGHAGWPNSVFLLPDGRPFHSGTYFPRSDFIHVLGSVAQIWRGSQRPEVEQAAEELANAIRSFAPATRGEAPPPGPEQFATAIEQLGEMHNDFEGGFSNAQQFPHESFLMFLIDHWRRTDETTALGLAGRTLEAIAAGGIHDHVGGGFHRYTVDASWRTPHFEKMLYNQAQISHAFIEGWEAVGNPGWRRAAERALAYVLRDMTDPQGAFYCAEDADSRDAEGKYEEGAFYVWPVAEVRDVLGADAEKAIDILGLTETATLDAGPVAHLEPGDLPDFDELDPLLERLRAAREKRPRPMRDEKIIAGWNGLMIRALAAAAFAFETPAYAEAAGRAAETIWSRLWTGERLMRLWADERAIEDGALEDYAWLGLGLLSLYQATADVKWRERAATLARTGLTLFGDGKGRLKVVAEDGPLGPVYDNADGATPTGESSMIELLARLSRCAPDPDFPAAAEALRAALSGQLAEAPLLRPDATVASRIMEGGESSHRRGLAKGAVRAQLAPGGGRLTLDIAPGWHLNAPEPGPEGLIGISIEGAAVAWPEARAVALGFSDQPLRVYDGRLELALEPKEKVITLGLQACSDSACLAPETAIFRLR